MSIKCQSSRLPPHSGAGGARSMEPATCSSTQHAWHQASSVWASGVTLLPLAASSHSSRPLVRLVWPGTRCVLCRLWRKILTLPGRDHNGLVVTWPPVPALTQGSAITRSWLRSDNMRWLHSAFWNTYFRIVNLDTSFSCRLGHLFQSHRTQRLTILDIEFVLLDLAFTLTKLGQGIMASEKYKDILYHISNKMYFKRR